MTKEENDLLIQVGPGTPCGSLMRRYWQPASLSEELPQGGAPLPVRLLGEDLVLFRDDQGRPGLLGIHCSHRGADLSYGRVEDGGLRCIYHGWLYDIHGRCLDQPGEPGGGEHRDSIRHPAYPCEERAGVIFAYMGPGAAPLLPNYDFLSLPDDHVAVNKLWHDCNYLQGNEGNIDLLHLPFLHYSKRDLSEGQSELCGRGAFPGMENFESDLIDVGLRICRIRKAGSGQTYIRVATFVLPNFTVVPGGYPNWHVPIDDTHHWKYTYTIDREKPLDIERVRERRSQMTDDYKPIRNMSNRYMQDRESMKSESYSGIGFNFQVQDVCVTEGMGAVQDRTQEHLVASDAPIVISRKVLMKAIQDVQKGHEPPGVVRESKGNRFPGVIGTAGFIPDTVDWKDHCKALEAERGKDQS